MRTNQTDGLFVLNAITYFRRDIKCGIIARIAGTSGTAEMPQQNVMCVTQQTHYTQSTLKLETNEMLERCEDTDCEYYDMNKVDLGWGYPVCRCLHAKQYPIPLESKYKGYKKYYRVIHCKVLE